MQQRIRRALRRFDADKVIVASDCDRKYLPRKIVLAKMKAIAEGNAIMRAEFP